MFIISPNLCIRKHIYIFHIFGHLTFVYRNVSYYKALLQNSQNYFPDMWKITRTSRSPSSIVYVGRRNGILGQMVTEVKSTHVNSMSVPCFKNPGCCTVFLNKKQMCGHPCYSYTNHYNNFGYKGYKIYIVHIPC